jgi:hypothetical protein
MRAIGCGSQPAARTMHRAGVEMRVGMYGRMSRAEVLALRRECPRTATPMAKLFE